MQVPDYLGTRNMDPSTSNRPGWLELVSLELRRREGEFLSWQTLRVFCGTWNVNEKSPPREVRPWLVHGQPEPPHIYALGLQEIDMSAAGLVAGERDAKFRPWLDTVQATVDSAYPGVRYRTVASRQLVGMLCMVYARADVADHVSDIQVCAVGTGLMGIMGNKGGIGVSFKIFGSSFCFVNSHLAAHTNEVERRNADFQEIGRRIIFNSNGDNTNEAVTRAAMEATGLTYTPPAATTTTKPLFDHDYLFWFGDLNYRLPNSLGYQRVVSAATSGDCSRYRELLVHDQLVQQRGRRNVFQGFTEPPVTFPPTYKYIPGTNTYYRYNPEKLRLPAWCDRVMWLVRPTALRPQQPAALPASVEEWLAQHGMHAIGATVSVFAHDSASQEGAENSTPVQSTSTPAPAPAPAPSLDALDALLADDVPAGIAGVDSSSDDDPTQFLSPTTAATTAAPAPADTTIIYDPSVFPARPALADLTPSDAGEAVECVQYAAIDAPVLQRSDHHPVRGIFLVRVRMPDSLRREAVVQSIVGSIDAIENQALPRVDVSTNCLDFGEVRHSQAVSRTLTITNSGTSPAEFSFVPKPSTSSALPPWLSVSHQQCYLVPGESIVLNFAICIRDDLAASMNSGAAVPDDILVLHLAGGRDHFISVTARWKPSCFGASLSELLDAARVADPSARLPQQLWWLGELMLELGQGLATPDLFVRSAPPSERRQIADLLDTPPVEFPNAAAALKQRALTEGWSAHGPAEVIMHFLSALREPIWPAEHYRIAVGTAGAPAASRALADQTPLSAANYIALLYIVGMLRAIASESEHNHLPCDQLALLFAPILLRPPPGTPADEHRAALFLESLISA